MEEHKRKEHEQINLEFGWFICDACNEIAGDSGRVEEHKRKENEHIELVGILLVGNQAMTVAQVAQGMAIWHHHDQLVSLSHFPCHLCT